MLRSLSVTWTRPEQCGQRWKLSGFALCQQGWSTSPTLLLLYHRTSWTPAPPYLKLWMITQTWPESGTTFRCWSRTGRTRTLNVSSNTSEALRLDEQIMDSCTSRISWGVLSCSKYIYVSNYWKLKWSHVSKYSWGFILKLKHDFPHLGEGCDLGSEGGACTVNEWLWNTDLLIKQFVLSQVSEFLTVFICMMYISFIALWFFFSPGINNLQNIQIQLNKLNTQSGLPFQIRI